ncbi:hypothetical protein [Arthrobacter sp. MDT1-65]
MESYLARYRRTLVFEEIERAVIERLISGFCGADLFRTIIDVVEPA